MSAEVPVRTVVARKRHARADNERRLARKCKELGSELLGSATKVAAALKLGEEDAGTIDTLKDEVEKAWRVIDASREKVNCSVVNHSAERWQRH